MASDPTSALIADIEHLVSLESPSGDVEALRSSAAAVSAIATRLLGSAPILVEGAAGPHLHWSGGPETRVLILGHHDTVHPRGTIERFPFAVDGDVARGPGVFDMKAGIVIALHAVAALEDRSAVEILITADEETGSATSKQLILERARAAGAVLVLEPSADGGALKTARKGTGTFVVAVEGRSSHAGLEPEKGINAVLALAEVIPAVARLADPALGTTVTPTMVAGGTADNVVPDRARCSVDVRVESAAEKARIEAAMSALTTSVEGATISVTGAIGRPPMPATASRGLYAVAAEVAAGLGRQITGVAVGGGSDGNFTAAAGVATLDGLGAVGGGAHGLGEWVDVAALVPRTMLLTGLVQRLSSMDRMPPLSSVPADL